MQRGLPSACACAGSCAGGANPGIPPMMHAGHLEDEAVVRQDAVSEERVSAHETPNDRQLFKGEARNAEVGHISALLRSIRGVIDVCAEVGGGRQCSREGRRRLPTQRTASIDTRAHRQSPRAIARLAVFDEFLENFRSDPLFLCCLHHVCGNLHPSLTRRIVHLPIWSGTHVSTA